MSEKTIKLPSGATVTLTNPAELKVKDRTKIFAYADTVEGVMQTIALTNGVIACLVKEWSYDLLPPSVKMDSLGELPIADYDALVQATAEGQTYLFPSLAQTLENEADPKADTANSNA